MSEHAILQSENAQSLIRILQMMKPDEATLESLGIGEDTTVYLVVKQIPVASTIKEKSIRGQV